MMKPAMTKTTRIEIAVLSGLLLTAAATWYAFGQPAVGAARVSSPIGRYKPMGVENPEIRWDRLFPRLSFR
jgi:hypothetical protein